MRWTTSRECNSHPFWRPLRGLGLGLDNRGRLGCGSVLGLGGVLALLHVVNAVLERTLPEDLLEVGKAVLSDDRTAHDGTNSSLANAHAESYHDLSILIPSRMTNADGKWQSADGKWQRTGHP